MIDPTHIIVDSAPHSSEAPLFIASASLLVSIASALTTYWLNIRGRRSSWFHKVAVDPMLDPIFDFFDEQQGKLADAAIANTNAKPNRKTPPRELTIALNDFRAGHTALYDHIASRLEVFNSSAATKITTLMESHQDSIGGAVLRSRESVLDAITAAKSELMSALRSADR